MATRYWVGGDGNWSQANLHWSNSSGGAPSASYLPTSADDVVFDANSNSGTSAFTVFVDGVTGAESLCQNFSTSSLDGAMTLQMSATSVLNCYGSMTLPATNFTWTGVAGCAVWFLATTTGKTITTNGVILNGTTFNFNGVGGYWTLGSAVQVNQGFNVINGTLDTANFNLTGGSLNALGGTKTILLGSSTVTLTGGTVLSLTTTGLTWNAGTSSIVCNNTTVTFVGAGLTFYNVEFSGGAGTKTISGANTFSGQFLVSNAAATAIAFGASQTFTGGALVQATTPTVTASGFTLTGTFEFASAAHGVKTLGSTITFQNLKVTCPAVDGTTTLSCGLSPVVTGTLTTTNGGSTARRVLINSTVAGTQRTLSVGTNSLINTDFQDIAAAGTASWVFGLGYGNLGNNTGITFDSSPLYWIGGSGTWSDGTKWSASSGGSAANAVPGPQNSVIFDANSNVGTGTFTVTGTPTMYCNDFSTGGGGGALDGAMTFTLGATAVLQCSGSMTLPASNFAFSSTTGSSVIFVTTGSATLTSNGVSFGPANVSISAPAGTVTLGSALTNSGLVAVNNGTLTTSNFNISTTAFVIQNATTKTVNLGSSTITSTGTTNAFSYSGSNVTFNAGTSTINCSNASPTFAGGGLTFYNVGFTSTGIGAVTITGSNTFNNLSFTARTAAGFGQVLFDAGATNTVNGTLTLGSGTTGVARLFVRSNSVGSTTTLSVATLTAITDIDFRDIIVAGASSPWSGTRIGNCLGNTNITFTGARTVYWNSAASANWNAAVWSTTSGNTGGTTTAFPLAQDSIVIDNAGLTTGNTITMNGNYNVGNLSFSTRSNAATFATGTTSPVFYGDYTLSSAITVSGTATILFAGQNKTSTITSAGVTFTQPTTISAFNGGTVRINGNLTLGSTLTTTFNAGTLDLTNNGAGNYTLSTGIFSSSSANTRAITFGTGNITLTGNNATIFTIATATNFTYTGTPTVNCTYSGSTGTRIIQFGNAPGATAANVVNFNISAGSDTISATTVFNCKNLDFTGFSGTFVNTTRNIYGNLIVSSGMTLSSGTAATNFAATSGTQQITSNGKTLDFPVNISNGATLQLQDNLTLGSTQSFTLTTGTLDLTGNSGNWTLSTGIFSSSNSNTRSIVFGTGNITVTGNNAVVWSTATATGFTYTGTPTVNFTYSGAVGTRTMGHGSSAGPTETNSPNFNITAGTDIISLNSYNKTVNFTGFSGTLNNNTRFIYGNLIISSGMTCTAGTAVTNFTATSGTQQITTNGNATIDFPITVNAPGATVQLQDNLTIGSTRTFTLTAGTLDLNSNKVLSTGLFSSSNSNTRSILFGTGSIVLTTNNNTCWSTNTATNFSYTGTSNIIANYAGSTGTRSFFHGGAAGGTEANALNLYITAGSDTVSVGNPFYAKNLDFTGFSGTLSNSSRYIFGNLVISTGMTLSSGTSTTSFRSASATQQFTTNGKTIDFPLAFEGAANTTVFQDALTQGSTRSFLIGSGTVQLKASTTNVVGALTITGTGTKALQSTIAGTQATISQASGDVYADYITIKDSNATGGANFYATAASNGGNDTGWNFGVNFYYWVGGDGNWSDAANHWSNTSGGSPSASYLPTAADIVIFDANSNSGTNPFTVTVDGTIAASSVCNDFVCGTGLGGGALDGTMTLALGTTAALSCYGSFSVPSTNFATALTAGSIILFRSTATGKTITTNGVSFANTNFYYNGISGGWTLGGALTANGQFFQAGTFNTANYTMTVNSLQRTDATNSATVNLGSSAITCSGTTAINFTLSSGLTLNAGTSTISCSGSSPTFAGGGFTFYNVSFTSTAIGNIVITGNNTFNNLTFTPRAAAGEGNVAFDAGGTNTVNGTLTFGSGTTGVARLLVRSVTAGAATTISAATITSPTDIDFRDITASGASIPWSGNRLGNCLGNTNINFGAGTTKYWVSPSSDNWSGAVWSTTSGNTGGTTTAFPLPQDSIVIDDAGLTAGNVITVNAPYQIPNLSFATRTAAATFATGGQTPTFYGDLTYSAAVTPTGTAVLTFNKQSGTAVITSAGITFPQPVTMLGKNGTLAINGNLTLLSTNTFTLTQGTLDLTNNGAGNYTLSTGLFSSSNSNTRSIAFGTGNITLTGSNAVIWTTSTATNFSYTGTPTVNATYSGSVGTRTINNGGNAGGTESNAISFNITAGSDSGFSIGGNGVYKNIDFTGFTGSLANGTRNVYGNLTFSSGMTCSSGTNYTIFAATSGTQQITTNGQTLDFPLAFGLVSGTATYQFQDALTQGAGRAFPFNNGTLKFKSGTTNTVGIFTTTGTTLKYLQATTPGSQATITTADTTPVYATYLNVKDSYAAQVNFWHALFTQNNQNGGNNTNWIFNASNNNFFMMFA